MSERRFVDEYWINCYERLGVKCPFCGKTYGFLSDDNSWGIQLNNKNNSIQCDGCGAMIKVKIWADKEEKI